MKYCKKCFRNVREDVNVCPYCGAPGLTEYGSSSSGEDFSCTEPQKLKQDIADEIKSLNVSQDIYDEIDTDETENTTNDSFFDEFFGNDFLGENKKASAEDAYSNKQSTSNNCNEVEYDAYGSKVHNDEDCENAPDTPQQKSKIKTEYHSVGAADLDPTNPKYKMRIEYLNMLKKIDGITPARIDELMARYDEMHSDSSTGTKKGTVKTVKTYSKTIAKNISTGKGTLINIEGKGENGELSDKQKNALCICVAIFFFFISPILAIVAYFVLKQILNKSDNKDVDISKSFGKMMLILAILFAVFTVVGVAFGIISSMGGAW
jgi:hypothetical protein